MPDTSAERPPSWPAFALAVLMLLAGVAHFAFPQAYRRIVPRAFGDAAFWVWWSGVAELACAGLLAGRRTRRTGALLTIAILVGVFPANVKMALDGGIPGRSFPLGSGGVAWARLPLQIPLVVWAWRVAATAPTAGRRRVDADRASVLAGEGGPDGDLDVKASYKLLHHEVGVGRVGRPRRRLLGRRHSGQLRLGWR